MALIKAAKSTLRKEIEKKIFLISKEEKERQTNAVITKLLALPVFQNSSRISIYLSTENEISTQSIINLIFNTGKFCFVPRYNKSIMEMVKLNSMQDWEELPLTKWNIKQPALSDVREEAIASGGLDLLIVPGVAFSTDGTRLGHGKGYYDTYLTNLKKSQSKQPITVALAFKEQIASEIPTHDHDVKIDYVLFSD